ncbi:hypothetical protein M0R45_030162 [Rubus argutus]|uniref:Uncharacterized protein n=1 Tax=Rubus argutus TaxID=59490 RepID=A0AAW1WE83_RUBAR
MRIRKRQVPLPLSSLSPVPLPDPHLLNLNHCSSSPMVQRQLQTHDDPKPSNPPPRNPSHHVGPLHPQPSDHPNPRPPPPIGAAGNGCDFSGEQERKNYFPEKLKGEDDDGSRDQGEKKSNDTRNGSLFGAETVSGFPSESSSSSHRVLGRWFEGEKAFPFKKRRGSFGEATRMDKEKKLTKTKMDKKCDNQQSDDKKQEDKEITKEGLDHNVGSGSIETKAKQSLTSSSLGSTEEEERKPDMLLDVNHHGEDQRHENDHGEEKKPLVVTKKRMKLGIVKARSMSSLLGQTNSASAVDEENNK